MAIDLSRVTLRPFSLTDARDFLRWASDVRVTGNLRWQTFTSEEEALVFVRDVCLPHPWRRSICIDDRSIGFISVFPETGDDRFKAHIGYGLSHEDWGNGIATRAVSTAVPQVFNDLSHVLRLQAFVQTQNKASQRVLEKVGFQKEGLLRKYSNVKGEIHDVYVYSLLSSDLIPLP
ncbi:GNAT domain-containing protein [Hirschfeldia incana]|nr:GNAT domain-containing protein [Hirschfeldia incana]